MDYLKQHRKLISILCFIILIVILFVVSYKAVDKIRDANKIKEIQVTTTPVDPKKLPEGFLSSVPIEKGAKITQNYNAVSEDGRVQATRTFETKKSLIENFKIYEDYLKNNDWQIDSTVDQTSFKMLFGKKDGSTLQISMSENSLTKIRSVNISFTGKKN